jgi:polyphosphate kinase 2
MNKRKKDKTKAKETTKKQKDKKETQERSSQDTGVQGGRSKLKRKEYEAELEKLQIELVKLQEWVKHSGARIVAVFEGRDAAGKGGIIKRITERVSPRVFRVTALPAPTDREKTQIYMQRYMAHIPAAGEIVIFDRSWYNRAGVEPALGSCTQEQYEKFLRYCDRIEYALVDDGIQLIKYWVSVSHDEQERRFQARIDDPLRQWKLSPTDLHSVSRWYDYSRKRDAMFMATDTDFAPRYVVRSNDKRRARLNCIRHFLSLIPYEDVPREKVKIPKRDTKDAYDDASALLSKRFVPDHY